MADPALQSALDDAAAQSGTGCLYVTAEKGSRSGAIWFLDGQVCAVHVDGFAPKVGQRLHTGGMFSARDYDVLLAMVGGDPYDPSLGTRAVQRGLVAQETLDAVLRELALASLGAICDWPEPQTRFHPGSPDATVFLIQPVSVNAALRAIDKRRARWAEIWGRISDGTAPEHACPVRVVEGDLPGHLPNEMRAVFAAADGTRPLDDVAGECGLTRFETGHVLEQLVSGGMVRFDHRHDPAPSQVSGTAEAAAAAPGTPGDTVPPSPSVEEPPMNDQQPGGAPHPQFAPDVLEAVAHPALEDPAGPSAFGAVEEDWPSGTDLGTLTVDTGSTIPVVAPVDGEAIEVAVPPRTDEVLDAPSDPGPPQEAPVFVDSAALDQPRQAQGMPEVPLPPLPVFDTPVAPVAPTVEPVAEEPTATPVTETPTVSTPTDPTGETVTVSPVDTDHRVEPATEEPTADPATSEPAHDVDPPTDWSTAARAGLAAAETGLARAQEDLSAHRAAAQQAEQIRHQCQERLAAAQQEAERLRQERHDVDDRAEEVAALREDAVTAAATTEKQVAAARDQVEAAKAALLAAEQAAAVAEQDHQQNLSRVADIDTDLCTLTERTTQVDTLLDEATARLTSHENDVREATEVWQVLAEEAEAAEQYCAAAEQRLASARRRLDASPETPARAQ